MLSANIAHEMVDQESCGQTSVCRHFHTQAFRNGTFQRVCRRHILITADGCIGATCKTVTSLSKTVDILPPTLRSSTRGVMSQQASQAHAYDSDANMDGRTDDEQDHQEPPASKEQQRVSTFVPLCGSYTVNFIDRQQVCQGASIHDEPSQA